MLENLEQVKEFASDIQPIIDYAEGIFRCNFPDHHAHYRSMMSDLVSHPNLQSPLLNLFGPWACCGVNSGGRVVSVWHQDVNNYSGNFCVIIPFDYFDYSQSARLVIDVGGGHSVGFELPPGIPFFFPSSLLAHYNTSIMGDDERRGSLVFWIPGPVVQWLELGGRPEKDLSPAELFEWVNGFQARALAILGRYSSVRV
ncbi:hypothetical protein M407DRAFT_241301 [Tulasnella calospora MUT 4182]|uniref:JmjC domain-containing protein n=1 Tax=Tulasnella calospora MUT 4182 TaxID=1051891 RepID=A0A0C3QVW6_9AGAM|nr:hypothetical protein M407DRAFT_241301 [Tulasnella calospora MUT 4182]